MSPPQGTWVIGACPYPRPLPLVTHADQPPCLWLRPLWNRHPYFLPPCLPSTHEKRGRAERDPFRAGIFMYVEIHPSFSLHVSATPYHVWSSRSVAAHFRLRSNLGRDTLFHRIAGLTRGAVSVGPDCARLVGHRQEGQHRDVADDRQRDSDAEADERELRAIGAVRRVHVAQGRQDCASRTAEQAREEVARLLTAREERLARHEHLVVLILHDLTPIGQGDRGCASAPRRSPYATTVKKGDGPSIVTHSAPI